MMIYNDEKSSMLTRRRFFRFAAAAPIAALVAPVVLPKITWARIKKYLSKPLVRTGSVEIFTASGTWTKPGRWVTVTMWGAGGGGGSVSSDRGGRGARREGGEDVG